MDGKSMRVIGVDVSKRWLDSASEGSARTPRIDNTAEAIAAFVDRLDATRDVVVLERSGGYERGLEGALAAAGIAFSLAHSRRVKAFREARNLKAKTDRIDAKLLMAFGRDQLNLGTLQLGRLTDVTFAALMARLRQLSAMLHAERCRHETAACATVRASIARMIATLSAELAAVKQEIAAHEAADPELVVRQKALDETTGVAQQTARALLAALPELGRLDRQEVTALAGLAPRTHQSGPTCRRRGLAPGRTSIKVILFNPARTAMRHDPDIRAFAERMRGRGKAGKVIMVAVMRKMLIRLNARLREAMSASKEVPCTP